MTDAERELLLLLAKWMDAKSDFSSMPNIIRRLTMLIAAVEREKEGSDATPTH